MYRPASYLCNLWTQHHNRLVVFLVFGLLFSALIHIEFIMAREYAPEAVLFFAPQASACSATISTSANKTETKQLSQLESIYDYLDAAAFTTPREAGYFLLETGLDNYYEQYEMTTQCTNSAGVTVLAVTYGSQNPLGCSHFNRRTLIIC